MSIFIKRTVNKTVNCFRTFYKVNGLREMPPCKMAASFPFKQKWNEASDPYKL